MTPIPRSRALVPCSTAFHGISDFKVQHELRYVQWERARYGGPTDDPSASRARRKRWLKEEN